MICEWTHAQVLDWLNSMNLFNVKEQFKTHRVSGTELIAMTDGRLTVSVLLDFPNEKSV